MINEEVRKLNKTKREILLMNDQYYVWLYPPMEKLEKSKNFNQFILMNIQLFLMDPVLLKKYNLFSQNIEYSLEQ